MQSMTWRLRSTLAAALVAVAASASAQAGVRTPIAPLAQEDRIEIKRGVPLRYDPRHTGLRVTPPLEFRRLQKGVSQAQATITVNYLPAGATFYGGLYTCEAWNAQAQAAFTLAANIWASLIQSPVPIAVDACWTALEPGVLGAAGPTSVLANFMRAPKANTFYPIALANALSGADQDTNAPEINALFSSAFDSSWYYETDGNPPPGRIDFVSVVLHELGHGLGFTGSMAVDASVGQPTSGQGSWGLGAGIPVIYDRFTENGAGTALIDTGFFANPSLALAAQLTSNDIFFDGTSANAANDGTRVPLYAPATWNDGSSYAHLAESFNGTANALMTFSLSDNESIHSPGPVTLGMFRDLGWTLEASLPSDPVLTVAKAGSGSGTIASSPAGIDCGTTCSAQFLPDATVTLTATAAGGSTFTGWTGNAACSGTETCILTMSAAQSVTANFAVSAPNAILSPLTLPFGTRTLGAAPGSLVATLQNTGTATLLASFSILPAGEFSQVNNCGGSVVPGDSCDITVSFAPQATGLRVATLTATTNDPARPTIDAALTGTGVLPTFALTVVKAGGGSGSVTSTPAGIECGATCTTIFDSGTAVALTAMPATGSLFAGWSGACGGTGSCEVTMNAARSVTATFIPAIPDAVLAPTALAFGSRTLGAPPASLQATLQNTGTAALVVGSFAITGANAADFSQQNTCGASVPVGSSCTITASFAPTAAGSRTAALSFATNDPLEPTLQVPLSGTGVLPAFALTVSKAGAGNGTVTSAPPGIDCGASCTSNFDSGTLLALTAVPGAGSFFDGWSGDCTGAGSCNLVMSAARAVTATFKATTTIPRLANISTRMQVLTGNDVLIGGFIIGSALPKTVVVRARGPSLVPLGVSGAIANPQLQLFSGQALIDFNDDWGGAANAAAILSSGFAPASAQESAILTTLAPGPYTAIVSGVGGTTGVGIVEVFEVDLPEVPLINIATRGQVLTNADVMIGGFIIQGDAPQTVIVRARGPSLTAAGVPGALQDPVLQLFSGQTQIGINDDWQADANAAQIQSRGFAPSDARESAILVTLPPGAYTAIVTGKNGTTGVGIIEVFAQ